MASKPRNISSSPTNLSPSRVALRNATAASAGERSGERSGSISGSLGRSPGERNGAKKGSSSPMSTNAGRTPQTRRKELALQQQNSPTGSPKNSSSTSIKKNSTSSTSSRRNSVNNGNNHGNNGSNGNRHSINVHSANNNRRHRNGRGLTNSAQNNPSTADHQDKISKNNHQNPTSLKLREETKFDGLWDVKTIENGLVRIPTQCLQDLITRDPIEKFYEVEEKPVASGLFATVRRCVHRETGITYAAKFCSRIRCGVDCSMEILHEITMLSVCTDSNKIVHLKDVFQNKHEIILVLEYAPGGDFQSVLDEDMVPFEEDVQGFLRQILEALDFIHDRNIAHLDIKPQNIVLMGQFPNCEIKLCDLEVARVVKEDEDIREIIGTPDYVAPEILSMDPITLSADIWSLGVVAYVLLTGFSPFGGDTDQETLRNITTATPDFPQELFEGVSDLAKEFISLCLVRDPTKRPTVKECLAHVWLAPEEEPPSPSPLMLKIPTPDLSEPIHKHGPSVGHGHGSNGGHGHGSNAGHGHGPSGGGSLGPSTRRSCQTCRDKITERKRYLSKSREAIFEKVAQSNLKKSLSKSRERLCDMRLTLSKSRDNLGGHGDVTKVISRQQDKLYGFKNLSKSQEVISAALGGVPMKRMINGAVSDISHALKQPPAGSELPSPSLDFIFVPGSGILVPQTELLKINSGSLQILPFSESGRSTPASQASVATLQDNPVSQAEVFSVNNANVVVISTPHPSGSANLVETPLIEVSEEEDNDSTTGCSIKTDKNEKSSSSSTLSSTCSGPSVHSERASSVPKDIKESQNYEKKKKQSTKKQRVNPLEAEILALKAEDLEHSTQEIGPVKETISVGVQVNLIQAEALPAPTMSLSVPTTPGGLTLVNSCPSLARKLAHLAQEPEEMNLDTFLMKNNKQNYESKTLPRRKSNNDVTKLMKQSSVEEKPAPLRRGFTHDHMLGMDQKTNPAWMDEIKKIRSLKPIRISELIGTFDNKTPGIMVPETDPTMDVEQDLALIKQKRRGSLQIHLEAGEIGQLANAAEQREAKRQEALLKSQRRKSTPSNLLSNSSNLEAFKIEDQIHDILHLDSNKAEQILEEQDEKKDEMKKEDQTPESTNRKSEVIQRQNKGKNWYYEYFEIDHPKAISDKKLQQLKSKYLRRRTEGSIKPSSIKEESEGDLLSPTAENGPSDKTLKAQNRSKSVPMSMGSNLMTPGSGPQTDLQMEVDEEGAKIRRISTDSGEESADSSRRSSRSSVNRRRSSHLSEFIDNQKCRGMETNSEDDNSISNHNINTNKSTEEKKRRRLSVEISNNSNENNTNNSSDTSGALKIPPGEDLDHGFISLPHTPTDLGSMLDPRLKIANSSSVSSASASTSQLADDGIFTSSEETLTSMKKAISLDDTCYATNCDTSSRTDRPSSAASAGFLTSSAKSTQPISTPVSQPPASCVTQPISESADAESDGSSEAKQRRQSVCAMIRPSSS